MDLGSLPPIFIFSIHLQTEELHEIEDRLNQLGGKLTYQANEARIFLGRVKQKKRAAFDLRAQGVWTEEVTSLPFDHVSLKRRKGDDISLPLVLSDSETEKEEVNDEVHATRSGHKRKREDEANQIWPHLAEHVMVLRLDWLEDCVAQNKKLPYQPYLVFAGRIVSKPSDQTSIPPNKNKITYIKATPDDPHSQATAQPTNNSLQSSSPVLEDFKPVVASSTSFPFHRRKFGQRSPQSSKTNRIPQLHRTTTSEFEETNHASLPPPPAWLSEPHPRPLYSCLRSTPAENPNEHFIAQLTKIKTARLLTLDEIGVRAYSTSIAALSAYPYRITSAMEITRLPGCDQKIASLWLEWRDSITPSSTSTPTKKNGQASDIFQEEKGETIAESKDDDKEDDDASLDHLRTIPIVNELDNDQDLQTLRLFYEIWGVGAETARKFYYQCGFRDLDDLIEYHWESLTRVQQIGVKFYDEFQVKIPRDEVESIARTILHSARKARNIPEKYWSDRQDVVENLNNSSRHKRPKNKLTDRNEFASTSNQRTQSTATYSWTDPHGKTTHPQDFILIIVGGHRRGKPTSGDVDVILTHRDETMTQDLIVDIVHQLETENYITHTLTLHTTTSDRGGATLPYRDRGHAGHGFDSLDKALVVWQNPNPPTFVSSSSSGKGDKNPKTKNTNIHRRVDIIISPWKTIGCAVLGWSGGTTFQRDVRRWAKKEKGWKFDSSGVRDRRTGLVVDLESPPHHHPPESLDGGDEIGSKRRGGGIDGGGDTDGDGWEDRERRLMDGLGIGWREARFRCTG